MGSVETGPTKSYHRVTKEDGVIVQLTSKIILDLHNSGTSDFHIRLHFCVRLAVVYSLL